jgi:hypothetical protein
MSGRALVRSSASSCRWTDVGHLGRSMAQQQAGSQGVINAFLSVRGDDRRGNDGQTAAAAGRSR